jgi:hypothetical protein
MKKKEETKISFTKDVLPYVIPLTLYFNDKKFKYGFCKNVK